MAVLLRVLCLFIAGAFVAAAPVKDLTSIERGMESIAAIPRDTDYVRNPLSDWDTPLPVRDDEPIEPVPQQDLKL